MGCRVSFATLRPPGFAGGDLGEMWKTPRSGWGGGLRKMGVVSIVLRLRATENHRLPSPRLTPFGGHPMRYIYLTN